jgi:hypothetical protein
MSRWVERVLKTLLWWLVAGLVIFPVAGVFHFFAGLKWLFTGLVPWLKLRYGQCAETRATYIKNSGHMVDHDWCFRYAFTVDGQHITGDMSSGYDFCHTVLCGYEVPEMGVFMAPNAIPIRYLVSDPRVHSTSPPKELAALANVPPKKRPPKPPPDPRCLGKKKRRALRRAAS